MRKVILMFLCLLLSGCITDNYVIKPKKDWEAEKAQLEKKYDDKANAAIKDIETKTKEKEAKEINNLQKASGLAYGILQLSEVKPEVERTRPDTLINFKSKELVSRLPNLPLEDILKINEELKRELDEKNTSLLELQKKYNEALKQAEKDKLAILAIQKEIDIKKGELVDIEKARVDAQGKLEIERRKAAELEASRQAQIAADAQKREEIIKYLIKIFVGIGVLASIGAYALRSLTLAAAAAGAFGLSVFIAFIEPWVVIVCGCLIIICAITGLVIKYYKSQKDKALEADLSARLVGSIENFKEKIGKEKFKQDLGPLLADWLKDAPELEDRIKTKIKQLYLD